MSTSVVVVLAVVLLLSLMALRVPIAVALGTSGVFGLFLLHGWSVMFVTLGEWPFDTTAKYTLVVIPLFVLMGVATQEAGLARRLFDIAHRFLARIPGGLAHATLVACAGFAAVSGSSNATAATIGATSIREMHRHNYDTRLAAGVVAAAGTLGVMIPPSVGLVIYAIITGERIGDLLLAGIVPGLISALLYGAFIFGLARFRPELVGRGMRTPAGSAQGDAGSTEAVILASDNGSDDATSGPGLPSTQVKTAVSAGTGTTVAHAPLTLLEVFLLFFVVIGGLYSGILTATEAAAFGALAALVILILRVAADSTESIMHKLVATVSGAAQTTGFLFFIVVGGSLFTFFLVSAGVPSAFSDWIISLPIPSLMIVAFLLLAMIPLGMFLDPISTMLIMLPIAHPVVLEAGLSGVWFGVLIIKAIEIGLITPPLGLNVFVVAGAAKVPMEAAFKGALLFLPIDVLTVILLFLVPEISLWLPGS